MNRKKIGLFGGTFNPVHKGHIGTAEYALSNFELDEIWFIPNYIPPHKKMNNEAFLLDHRINMLRSAISHNDRFALCDMEIKRGGKSYTFETLNALTSLYPDVDFYFIIGEDSLHQFEEWVHPETIARLVHILAAHRKQDTTSTVNNGNVSVHPDFYEEINRLNLKYNNAFIPMEMKEIDVSSTLIRNKIRSGEDITGLVPVEVIEYIRENHLYV